MMALTPSTTLFQKAPRESAPGRRVPMPTMATYMPLSSRFSGITACEDVPVVTAPPVVVLFCVTGALGAGALVCVAAAALLFVRLFVSHARAPEVTSS